MTTSSIKTEVPVAKKLMGQRSQEESQLLDPAGGQSLLLDPFLGSESKVVQFKVLQFKVLQFKVLQFEVLQSKVVQSKVVRDVGRIQHP